MPSLPDSPKIVRKSIPGPTFSKHVLTSSAGRDPLAMLAAMREAIGETGGAVLNQFVFGGCRFQPQALESMGSDDWPVTWLEGDPCSGENLSASQATVLSGIPVENLMLDRRLVGKRYEDEDAVYCHLGGLLPRNLNASREVQTRQLFEAMEEALSLAGLSFTDTVRTWLYLDRLLDWYDPFNVIRTQFFQERGVFDHMVPASTGIGAGNPAGAAIIGDLLAIRPKTGRLTATPVPSPLQCPALDYKSSFSRAVEIARPAGRELLISGTASIHPDGRSAHVDNVEKQIALTMEVVAAILHSRQMDWADATRGIAYVKDMADAPLLRQYCREHAMPDLPVALSHADVCRHDLLFELELDAWKTLPTSSPLKSP